MSTKTRNSKSRSTAASAETATGVQEDVVVTTATTSDPSGLRAPDGTNSIDTPQSSGDAAGDASANPVKPQVNADQTDAMTAEAASGTLNPEAEASTSGTHSDASQGEADGTGANAGPASSAITAALKVDDIDNLTEMLAMAAIGGKLLEIITDVARDYPALQEWIGSDDPASIVRELAEENAVLKDIRTSGEQQHLGQFPMTEGDIKDIVDDVYKEAFGEFADRYASMTRVEFERDFPLAFGLLSSFKEPRTMENPPLVRVTSERDGFRRGGIAHSSKPVDYRPWQLSPEQLEAIIADPFLTVEVV